MPLKTLVKVGRLTNLSEARYCAGMGVDLLGFRVIPGAGGYLPPPSFQEIRGWVTGPAIVAELEGITSAETLKTILDDYKPDFLEVGLFELALFTSLPLPVIINLEPGETLPPMTAPPAYVVISSLDDNVHAVPTLLSVRSKEQLQLTSDTPHLVGIAMNGSDEIRPGLTNYDGLAEILELLEEDS